MDTTPGTPTSAAGSPFRRSQPAPRTPQFHSSPPSTPSNRWRNSANYTPRSPSHLRQSTLSPEPEAGRLREHNSYAVHEPEVNLRSRGETLTPPPRRLTQAEMAITPPPLFSLSPGAAPGSGLGAKASTPKRPVEAPSVVGGLARDPLAKLHPAQVRELRESFQVLDADGDGFVDSADVQGMLEQLGLDQSHAALSKYFTPTATRLALPAYLSMLASLLAPLSAPSELLAAFSAFDDDDSGQIDVVALKEAMRMCGSGYESTAFDSVIADFSGPRAFSYGSTKVGSGGDVFRYREFVDLVGGGAAAARERAGAMAGSGPGADTQQMQDVGA